MSRKYDWTGRLPNSEELLKGVIEARSLAEARRKLLRQSYSIQTVEPHRDVSAEEALRQHSLHRPDKARPDTFRGVDDPGPPRAPGALDKLYQAGARFYFAVQSWLQRKRWSDQQKAEFHLQLGRMLESGIPIQRAFQIQFQNTLNPWVRARLDKLQQANEYVRAYSECELFSELELAQLLVGLESAQLGTTHLKLSEQILKSVTYRNHFVLKLLRPLSVLVFLYLIAPVVGALVGNLLLSLADLQASPTNRSLAGFFSSKLWLLLGWGLPLLLTFLIFRWFQSQMNSQRGERLFQLPVVGQILWEYDMANSLGVFAALLEGGFPLRRALALCQKISLSSGWTRMLKGVEEGGTLSAGLDQPREHLIQQYLLVGEESGKVPHLCARLQSNFESQAATRIDRLLAVLEPLLTAFIAGSVCALCLLVVLPQVQILQSL